MFRETSRKSSGEIDRAVTALINDREAESPQTCEAIDQPVDVLSRAVVKVVVDEAAPRVEFSRSPIPFPNQAVSRHGSIESSAREGTGAAFDF